MNNARFSIFEAVRDAYVFAGREWAYLLRAGLWVAAAKAASSFFIQFLRPDSSWLEDALWNLPATGVAAWFVFVETRLFLLGERMETLPTDASFRRDRDRALKLTVIVSLLINMAMAAVATLMMSLRAAENWGKSGGLAFAGLLLVGLVIWGLRFYILPVLAAVQYPFRPVLEQVWGIAFSFRLIGLGLVSLFPVVVLFQLVSSLLWADAVGDDMTLRLTEAGKIGFTLVGAVFSLLSSALLTAATAAALRQILASGKNGNGVLA